MIVGMKMNKKNFLNGLSLNYKLFFKPKITKMKRNTSWHSQKTIDLFAKELKKSPQNLETAFEKIAKQMGMHIKAVKSAWYRKNGLRETMQDQFMVKSKNVEFVNKKNIATKKVGNMIFEEQVSTKMVDNLKVVTIKQYYTV